ncbi:GNAT family N-acetyltransferase [Bacillus niameyensis]|uniref:GNAT family N-acetyltransferase n=1 Tax=Bacillus niameyensis TaxID=1522308 RepID=UPI0007865ADF|nr:GNAT family protein [Bacillus niameyensis]
MEIEHIYGDLPSLETERLLLRKVTMKDLHDIHHYGSDHEVSRYVTWDTHRSLADTEAFIQFVLERYENSQEGPWGIEWKENGKLIGTIDFFSWKPRHGHAEIGYVLSRDYWGAGIMTEAVREVVRFGFEKMDLVRIQARCMEENVASSRVMEKAGMSFEGVLRKVMYIKGKHRDLKMYSILKEEFGA